MLGSRAPSKQGRNRESRALGSGKSAGLPGRKARALLGGRREQATGGEEGSMRDEGG